MTSAATPTPGWYSDPTNAAALRWWDGSAWTPHAAPLPSFRPAPIGSRPPVWSRWLFLITAGWLVTLAVSMAASIALANARSVHGSWWPASIPLLIELVATLSVGAALGWRRNWREASVLGLASSVVILGAFMVGAAFDNSAGADDGAGAGMIIVGVPATLGLTALVLAGASVGATWRRALHALRRS